MELKVIFSYPNLSFLILATFNSLFIHSLNMSECFACMFICVPLVFVVPADVKKVLEPLELEFRQL